MKDWKDVSSAHTLQTCSEEYAEWLGDGCYKDVDGVRILVNYVFDMPESDFTEVPQSDWDPDLSHYLPKVGGSHGHMYSVRRKCDRDAKGNYLYLELSASPPWDPNIRGFINQLRFRWNPANTKMLISDSDLPAVAAGPLWSTKKAPMKIFKVPAAPPAKVKLCAQIDMELKGDTRNFAVFWCWPN